MKSVPVIGYNIEGANGASKTLLLRILAGLAPQDDGEIRWHQCRSDYYRKLLYIGHQAGIKTALTPWENMPFYQGINGTRHNADIRRVLEQIGYWDMKMCARRGSGGVSPWLGYG